MLAQTYERLQLLVIGDATEDETEAVVREISDSRLTFVNLTSTVRLPRPASATVDRVDPDPK